MSDWSTSRIRDVFGLHWHLHTIDEVRRRDTSGGRRVWLHRRWFLTVRRGEDGPEVFDGHVEAILRQPRREWLAARFHVGHDGSGTPWDGHLLILGSGAFWGLGPGRRLAARISRCRDHKYTGRDLAVRFDGSDLWLSAWVHPDQWTKGEFAGWRSGRIPLNPVEWSRGPRRYFYETLAEADDLVLLPEGTYPVRLKLRRMTSGRTRSARRHPEGITVDWTATGGIPTQADDGWKGGDTYGCSVEVSTTDPQRWPTEAAHRIAGWVMTERGRSGYRTAPASTPQET